jgi:hypothetical protein
VQSLVAFAEMRSGDKGVVRGRSLVKLRTVAAPLRRIIRYALRIGCHSSNVAVVCRNERDRGGITERPDLEVRREWDLLSAK